MTRPGPILGCIADDFTGAVDVAAGVFDAGLHTVIVTAGDPDTEAAGADVVVVALKSRTAPSTKAVADSVRAARALMGIGVQQLFFKYCSTFDSTSEGNIGPVADALVNLVDQAVTVVVPGYPAAGRTIRAGLLYVGDMLLSDSTMRHHPLTPMTSSDVPALLAGQSRHPVRLVDHATVRAGSAAIAVTLTDPVSGARSYAVFDTVTDADIDAIAAAVADHRLITGGAALAHAIAARSSAARTAHLDPAPRPEVPSGRRAVLSGSCSAATRGQVADFARHHPVLQLDPRQIDDPRRAAVDAAAWAVSADPDEAVLISTSVDAETLRSVQADLGRDTAARCVETFFGEVAGRLKSHGYNRIVVAGGETSAAVTAGLGVSALVVTTPISTGLAWCISRKPSVALALKSGNFGALDLFTSAHDILDSAQPSAAGR